MVPVSFVLLLEVKPDAASHPHPGSAPGWLHAVADWSFYLLGSVLCAALKLLAVLE